MPLCIDIHNLKGVSAEELAKTHEADLATQRKYGVEYRKYWFNESCGKAFCLFEAPSAEAAAQVHCEAHGQMAEKIIEVQPELAEGFLGGGEVNADRSRSGSGWWAGCAGFRNPDRFVYGHRGFHAAHAELRR